MTSRNQSHTTVRAGQSPSKTLRDRLMFAASAGILAMVAPSGFYGMRAQAQTVPNTVPDGCVDSDPNNPTANTNGDGTVDDGETLTCVGDLANPDINDINVAAANATIIIGDGTINTVVTAPSDPDANGAIDVETDGGSTIQLKQNAEVQGDTFTGVSVETTSSTDAIVVQGTIDENDPSVRHGVISGGVHGINAVSNGGPVTVSDLASVDGGTGAGIFARTTGGTATITDITGVTSDDSYAIDVDTRLKTVTQDENNDDVIEYSGGADISIQNIAIPEFDDDGEPLTPDVRSYDGIFALSGTGNINIGADNGLEENAIGHIFAIYDGINAQSDGGSIDIHTGGRIESRYGIITNTSDEFTKIVADGDINAGIVGIWSRTSGAGDIDITINGDVNTALGDNTNLALAAGVRINAYDLTGTETNPNSLSVELGTDGSIRGKDFGIRVTNSQSAQGSPTGTIKIEGDSTNTIEGGRAGISAISEGLAIEISGVGKVSGGTVDVGRKSAAIYAASEGGEISIRNIGGATAKYGAAIFAEARLGELDYGTGSVIFSGGGGDISIQNIAIPEIVDPVSGATSRSANGILAYSGTGSINIGADPNDDNSAIGDIFTTGTGIKAVSDEGYVKINADGQIDAGADGVVVENNGTADSTVTLNNVTSGDDYSAVNVTNGAGSYGLTVNTTGTISGGHYGILAKQDGLGDVKITTTGSVSNRSTPTGLDSAAIQVINTSGGKTTVQTDGSVNGTRSGVSVKHSGTGTATLTLNDEVEGASAVYLKNDSTSAAIINLGENAVLNGSFGDGIVLNSTQSKASATIAGFKDPVTGDLGGAIDGFVSGIDARTNDGAIIVKDLTSVAGGDVAIDFLSPKAGIYARSTGGTITLQNIASVTSKNGVAIDLDTRNSDGMGGFSGGGADISIQNIAIPEIDDGNPLTPNTRSAHGILAFSGTGDINIGAYKDLAANAIGDIYSTGTAIFAESDTGSISVSTKAGTTISSENEQGIELVTKGGTDNTITVKALGDITTARYALDIEHTGTGDVSVTTGGTIASAGSTALDLDMRGAGNLTLVTNGAINGAIRGIFIDYAVGVTATINGNISTGDSDGLEIDTVDSSENIIVNVNAVIAGDYDGLDVNKFGTGNTVVTLGSNGEIHGQRSNGVRIRGNAAGSAITVQGSSGTITGEKAGIDLITENADILVQNLEVASGGTFEGVFARSQGGKITIQNVDEITSRDSTAVDVDTRDRVGFRNYSGGGADISIQNIAIPEFDDPNSSDMLRSADGIVAYSGLGSINIGAQGLEDSTTIGTILTDGTAIYANSEGGYVKVNATGNIEARYDGVVVENSGTGLSDVKTGLVKSGDDYAAIDVTNIENALDSTTRSLSVTSTGIVDGGAYGIRAVQHGGAYGIRAVQQGSGDLNITANSYVFNRTAAVIADTDLGETQLDYAAIRAINEKGQNLTITTNDSVSGTDIGIHAVHSGTGTATINAQSSVSTSSSREGSSAILGINNSANQMTINADGAISSNRTGIAARTSNGALSVNMGAGGAITQSETGIFIKGEETSTGALTVNALGSIESSMGDAIYVNQDGTGAVSVTTGTERIRSTGESGINVVRSQLGNIEIETGGQVQAGGSAYAIKVLASGGGEIDVTTNGSVNSVLQNGIDIDVTNAPDPLNLALGIADTNVDLQVNGIVSGGARGVEIIHTGGGKVDVTLGSDGIIEGGGGDGLYVKTSSDGVATNIQGSSGAIGGFARGISAQTNNGDITIGSLDLVGGYNEGIFARSTGGMITIRDIDEVVSSNGDAINVYSSETADVSTDSYGNRSIDSYTGGDNISIQNVSIQFTDPTDGSISYSANGIRAFSGTGEINIGAEDPGNGTEIGPILTNGTGIYARSDGGPINVATSGDIRAKNGDGIKITNKGSSATTLNALGTIHAGEDAINLSIDPGATAATISFVNAYGDTGSGLELQLQRQVVDPTVTSTGTARGGQVGIDITHIGVGTLTVEANNAYGTVEDGFEIDMRNLDTSVGAALDLTANGTVQGGRRGMDLSHLGSGTAIITARGAVIGDTSDGLEFIGGQSGAHVTLKGDTTGSISGGTHGARLEVTDFDITIEDFASITGGTNDGINAQSQGGDITIQNIDSVTSTSEYAISANSGTGDIEIRNVGIPTLTSSTSNTTDRSYSAISANTLGGDITIETDAAIYAYNYGIRAKNGDDFTPVSSGSIDIRVSNVTSVYEAVFAANYSDYAGSTTSVTVSGDVSSDGAGVFVLSATGGKVTVTETGSIYGANRAINFLDEQGIANSDDEVILDGTLTGDVEMGGGDDTFNLGGTISEGSTLFGGDGTDTFNVSSVTGITLTTTSGLGVAIREFENFNFDGDNVTIAGDHVGWEQVNFRDGTTFLGDGQSNASLSAAMGTIFMGATLHARDNAVFTGNLINEGTLLIGDSPGRFNLNGDFTQSAEGKLVIEYFGDLRDGDFLQVSGLATLDGTLEILVPSTPTAISDWTFLQALGGINGGFHTIIENVPDINYTLEIAGTTATVRIVPLSVISPPPPPPPPPDPDPAPDPDPVPDPDPTPDPGDDTGSDPDDDSGDNPGDDPATDPGDDTGSDPVDPADPGDQVDPDPTPEPDPEPEQPLLSPKEIAPSALMAGMFASDLFASSLIERRSETMSTGDWDFWVSGLGGRYDVGNNQEVYGWDGGTSGFGFGVQHLIEQGGVPILFGLSTGFSESDVDSGFSHGKVDSLHLGGFANAQIGNFFLAASASHAWQDYDLQRVFVFSSTGAAIAVSETEGKSTTFKTEGYYDLLWSGGDDPGFGFGPLITADLTTGSYNAFQETGAGILNLSYDKETAQQTLLGAGVQGEYSAVLFGTTLVDTGFRLLAESVSGDTSITSSASLIVPGAEFSPNSAKLDNQRVSFGADAKVYFSDTVYGHIRYDTTQSDQFSEHKGWAGVTFRF